MTLSVVSIIDAACDAVNVLIMWNILYTDNDVRYVLMYILYVRTIDKPRMPHMNERMNNHSCVNTKKDHGIVDNGHTMRWRYHDIPWFILNGCRWLYDCKIEVLVVVCIN